MTRRQLLLEGGAEQYLQAGESPTDKALRLVRLGRPKADQYEYIGRSWFKWHCGKPTLKVRVKCQQPAIGGAKSGHWISDVYHVCSASDCAYTYRILPDVLM